MGIDLFIEGIPYGQQKPRGDIEAPNRWAESVKQPTKALSKVEKPCYMTAVFVLPQDKYPSDHPYGPDLDNLTKLVVTY